MSSEVVEKLREDLYCRFDKTLYFFLKECEESVVFFCQTLQSYEEEQKTDKVDKTSQYYKLLEKELTNIQHFLLFFDDSLQKIVSFCDIRQLRFSSLFEKSKQIHSAIMDCKSEEIIKSYLLDFYQKIKQVKKREFPKYC